MQGSHSISLFVAQLMEQMGRAIAQAISRRLPTAAARLRGLCSHVSFVMDKVTLGQVFSEYFGFPCQSSFHRLLNTHQHHLLLVADTVGQ
jgi:hypothetical protein